MSGIGATGGPHIPDFSDAAGDAGPVSGPNPTPFSSLVQPGGSPPATPVERNVAPQPRDGGAMGIRMGLRGRDRGDGVPGPGGGFRFRDRDGGGGGGIRVRDGVRFVDRGPRGPDGPRFRGGDGVGPGGRPDRMPPATGPSPGAAPGSGPGGPAAGGPPPGVVPGMHLPRGLSADVRPLPQGPHAPTMPPGSASGPGRAPFTPGPGSQPSVPLAFHAPSMPGTPRGLPPAGPGAASSGAGAATPSRPAEPMLSPSRAAAILARTAEGGLPAPRAGFQPSGWAQPAAIARSAEGGGAAGTASAGAAPRAGFATPEGAAILAAPRRETVGATAGWVGATPAPQAPRLSPEAVRITTELRGALGDHPPAAATALIAAGPETAAAVLATLANEGRVEAALVVAIVAEMPPDLQAAVLPGLEGQLVPGAREFVLDALGGSPVPPEAAAEAPPGEAPAAATAEAPAGEAPAGEDAAADAPSGPAGKAPAAPPGEAGAAAATAEELPLEGAEGAEGALLTDRLTPGPRGGAAGALAAGKGGAGGAGSVEAGSVPPGAAGVAVRGGAAATGPGSAGGASTVASLAPPKPEDVKAQLQATLSAAVVARAGGGPDAALQSVAGGLSLLAALAKAAPGQAKEVIGEVIDPKGAFITPEMERRNYGTGGGGLSEEAHELIAAMRSLDFAGLKALALDRSASRIASMRLEAAADPELRPELERARFSAILLLASDPAGIARFARQEPTAFPPASARNIMGELLHADETDTRRTLTAILTHLLRAVDGGGATDNAHAAGYFGAAGAAAATRLAGPEMAEPDPMPGARLIAALSAARSLAARMDPSPGGPGEREGSLAILDALGAELDYALSAAQVGVAISCPPDGFDERVAEDLRGAVWTQDPGGEQGLGMELEVGLAQFRQR